jgi:hypothetical protein
MGFSVLHASVYIFMLPIVEDNWYTMLKMFIYETSIDGT